MRIINRSSRMRVGGANIHRVYHLLTLASVAVALTPSQASAGEPQWWSGFFPPGTDRTVNTILASSDELIIAGTFEHVGSQKARFVASWNGSSWKSMNIPFEGAVEDLAQFNGELLACGSFAAPDGHCWLLRWDGQTWAPMGSQSYGRAAKMIVHHDSLYVVGGFWDSDYFEKNIVLRWDGMAWGPLQGDVPQGNEVSAHCATVFEDRLVVGGGTGFWGSPFVAVWEDTSWNTLTLDTTGVQSSYLTVHDLAVHEGQLYAGGFFAEGSSIFPNGVGVWDGSRWQALGNGLDFVPSSGRVDPTAQVRALSWWDGKLVIGGHFSTTADADTVNGIALWDGTRWKSVGSGFQDGGVYALAVLEGELIAGGGFRHVGGNAASNLALWNGNRWSTLFPTGSAIDGWVFDMTTYEGDLIAGGMFQHAGQVDASAIARWEGTRWTRLGNGIGGWVEALVTFENDLIVGGAFTTAGDGPASNVARWDGTSWAPMGSGLSGEVMTFAVHDGQLYAGGSFSLVPSDCCIARWDGTAWQTVGGGFRGDSPTVYALISFNGELFAGGWFALPPWSSNGARNLARWNGSSWRDLAGYPTASVTSFTNFNSRLVIAGYFDAIYNVPNVGSIDANHIVTWQSESWRSIGAGTDRGVEDLAVFQERLVAVGPFGRAGTGYASAIAAWNDSTWEALSSGLHGIAYCVESFNDHLFAGGAFSRAGGKPSYAVARWDENQATLTASNFEGKRESSRVRLSWQTNGSGRSFEILRESEGFITVLGRLTPPGPSAEFIDPHPVNSRTNYWLGEMESGALVGWLGPAVVASREFHFGFPRISPNPFTYNVELTVEVPDPGHVQLCIYDISGREVARLIDGFTPPGEYRVVWDGKDRSGRSTQAGIFFVRFDSPSGSRVQKVVKLHR